MTYRYLVPTDRHLVQLLACNLMNHGYRFYSTSWLPEHADPVLVDAKLTLLYETHLAKEKAYRRRKGGAGSVRYLRCGRLCVLVSTEAKHGRSLFFQREAWKDASSHGLHVAGYVLRLNRENGKWKVSVRLHEEQQRAIRRRFTEDAGKPLDWWENEIRAFPFLSFKGVRDNLFAELKELNGNRKLLRKPPVRWRKCVRKKFKVETLYLDSPPELLDLLRHYGWKG